MSEIVLRYILRDPEQARTVLSGYAYPWIKEQLAQGRQLACEYRLLEDARTIAQLNFLWGVVYKETAEQARIDGQQYTPDAWHELGKRLHLPRRQKKTTVAGRKKPVFTTTIGTLKGSGIRAMADYITKFMAWATTDYGVQFSEPLPAELRPGKRKAKTKEVIDAETGEITEAA